MGEVEDEDGPAPIATTKASVAITDVLGLGAIAKSAAGKEIGKAISKAISVVTDPTRSLLMGLAKTRIDAGRVKAIAKAEAEARQIQVASEQLIERMQERVIAGEIRKQLNIETATTEAIEIADSTTAIAAGKAIDHDWMHTWIEGAQEASTVEVRKFWSRVLATQSLASKDTVSKPSLNLLQALDSTLATALEDYIAFVIVYGCYPVQERINPDAISQKHLAMLEEIGFVKAAMYKSYDFQDFKLRLGRTGPRSLGMIHTRYDLTHRGYELCAAIFGDDDPFAGSLKGKQTAESDQIKTLIKLLDAAIQQGPFPVCLALQDKNKNDVVEVMISSQASAPNVKIEDLNVNLRVRGALISKKTEAVLKDLVGRHSVEISKDP
jgi:hypothetical protein